MTSTPALPPLHIVTPLLQSNALSRPGQAMWLKMEALQPAGSFKNRGVGHACSVYAARGARRFISSSGGNAGIACAYAGRKLGIAVTVVVPETASARALELIRAEQAELIVQGASFQEANEYAQSLLTAQDAFIHPFDDPLLWEGHASMIDEVIAAGVTPDAVVLSVGGGGLLCGVVQGLQRHGLTDVPVFAAETAGAASLAAAIAAGELVALPGITSIATSLGARKVAQAAFDATRAHPVCSTVVTDRAAVEACLRFIDDQRVVVEPACGAALAVAYHGAQLAGFRHVLVIVCGGVTATVAQLHHWAAQLPADD
jgi:L-serine/L-threonine ammonia-lyase